MLLEMVVMVAAHSNLIYPKPRNSIDSHLPEWSGGRAPYSWQPHGNPPCACRNVSGSGIEQACESAQTCLWFSVGCSIGCKTCDGGDMGGANPNVKDRCSSGMKATINDPKFRTINWDAKAGSEADWTRWNPWRAPGNAPVYDPCGRASGGPHTTVGHGEFTNTTYARVGDLGSKLPKQPSGAVWKAGSVVETMWSLRANHGGGYQYRLCPLNSELTEDCFQQTPMEFAGNSKLMIGNGKVITLNSTFVSEGTLPAGSTWQVNPIPGWGVMRDGDWSLPLKRWFDPPCDDPFSLHPPQQLDQGLCSGEWLTNVTTYDQLRVPEHLPPGEYVLGFRWDCEATAQVWQSCSDISITA
jgi:hypothetical protein